MKPLLTLQPETHSLPLKMPVHEFENRYGLEQLQLIGCRKVWMADVSPLTEEDEEWNRKADRRDELTEAYNRLQQGLSRALDDKMFIAECLCFVASKITGREVNSVPHMLQYEETDKELALSERSKNVRIRKRDATLANSVDLQTLDMLNRTLMSRNLNQPRERPEPDTPEILYRVFSDRCHGRHDTKLGFRSSRQPMTSPCYHTGTLLSSSLVDEQGLRNHCDGRNPSDLIALSDSPSRILNIINSWNFKDMRGHPIAVISVPKLLAMDVLFNRTTTLADSLKMEPRALRYANENYWVAYRWIPYECIESYISKNSLEMAWKNHSNGTWLNLLIGSNSNENRSKKL